MIEAGHSVVIIYKDYLRIVLLKEIRKGEY